MKIKKIKITKKDWYLKQIKEYLELYIWYEENEEISLEKYLEYKGKREFLIDYIKSDLEEELLDDLTCVNGVGGKQSKQVGMIEFINMFCPYLDFKVEEFNIERKNQIGTNADYIFKVKNQYEYLSTFFSEFINKNAEKILDEVEKC